MDFSFDDFDCNNPHDIRSLTATNVVGVWQETARHAPPWSEMPLDDRAGRIRPMAFALLDLSSGLYSVNRRRAIRSAAEHHGGFRRAQACNEETVADDFILLRVALKLALARLGVSNGLARQFIRCLLPDWRLARRSAIESHRTGRMSRWSRTDTLLD